MISGIVDWIKSWFRDPPPVRCPYCINPDRASVFINWGGCQWQNPDPGNGADPPCVCDGFGSKKQMGQLGLTY